MDGRRLNLLYFSHGYTTHDRRFLQAFVESDLRVSYLRLSGEQLEKRALPDGIRPIAWLGDSLPLTTPLNYYRHQRALKRVLAEVSPQIVLSGPVQSCAFLVATTGYQPLITMSWGSDLLVNADRSALMRAVTRFTLRRSAGIFGDCRAVREKVHEFVTLSDDAIVTFPWGIDLNRFGPEPLSRSLREDLGWTGNMVLISTRTWEPLYAIDVLVRAFANVQRQCPEVRLLLLGDGSQGPAIRRLISSLDLDNSVYMPGRVSNEILPGYFRSADVYVSSALSDGTSISLLEAMASGLPAVVTNGYGNNEWVQPGRNGWLANPGSSDSLTEALLEAVSDRSRLQEIGVANIAVANARANWSKNFPTLLEFFYRATEKALCS